MASATDDLISSVRLDDGAFYVDNPYPVYARLRSEAPVLWYEPGQCWLVSRYADVKSVSGNDALYSAQYGFATYDNFNVLGRLRRSIPEAAGQLERGEITAHEARRILKTVAEGVGSRNMTLSDPPLHTELRRLTNLRLSRKRIELLAKQIREITITALDSVPAGEPVDLVQLLAAPIPLAVIAELMGIPEEDRADFRRWSDSMIEIIDATDPDRIATLQGDLDEARSYFRQELQRRRAEPRDDMLSDIANGTVEGEPLQLPAQVRYATLMLSAGNETTRNLFSGGVKALMDYPEQLRLLQADESLVPLAVDELLRWTTPVNATGRTALEPAELEGQQIAVGDYIVMLYQSANRDERVWDRPGTLNIARKPIPMHEAFGTGQHVCLGQHVARFEARIMFEETFRRFRSVEPAGDPVWSNSTHVNGLAALPVIFQAA